jgi:hypothetical protein
MITVGTHRRVDALRRSPATRAPARCRGDLETDDIAFAVAPLGVTAGSAGVTDLAGRLLDTRVIEFDIASGPEVVLDNVCALFDDLLDSPMLARRTRVRRGCRGAGTGGVRLGTPGEPANHARPGRYDARGQPAHRRPPRERRRVTVLARPAAGTVNSALLERQLRASAAVYAGSMMRVRGRCAIHRCSSGRCASCSIRLG